MATAPKPMPLQNTEEEIEKAKDAVQDYDFIRFTVCDMNGIPRGCLVSGDVAPKFIPGGPACFSGLMGFGPNNELAFHQEVLDTHCGNVAIVPDLATLHTVPWVGGGKYSTGQFLGETHWNATRPQEAGTRNIARRMLSKLDDLGLKFYCGMELEYILLDRKTKEPVFDGKDYLCWLVQSEFDSWICDVQKSTKKAGVAMETMHTEYGPGQFEFATQPQFGIKAADASFLLKQGIKEMAIQRGWEANFMAQRFPKEVGSGAHFNFSVWKNDSDAVNVLWDPSGPYNLSELGRYWLGGMIRHAKAVTALCCITTNCYQRLHKPWVPHQATWGVQDRVAMVRVKNDGPQGTYYENRLASALCNPYLVMAATIAAGIDGVVNKISCPDPHNTTDAEELPHSLGEAMQSLQEDDFMVEALGKTFLEWFVKVKSDADMKAIEGVSDEAEQLAIQVKQYSKLC